MDKINVEEIMSEIRKEIKDKGYTPEMLSFQDVNASYIGEHTFDMETYTSAVANTNANTIIKWWDMNLGNGIKGVVKKIIRKMVFFVLVKIVDAQNYYNEQNATAMTQVLGYIEAQENKNKMYEMKIKKLESKIRELGGE